MNPAMKIAQKLAEGVEFFEKLPDEFQDEALAEKVGKCLEELKREARGEPSPMPSPWELVAITIRMEVARELIRRSLDGCLGVQAAVDGTTCLVADPDSVPSWCASCVMAAAADIIGRSIQKEQAV